MSLCLITPIKDAVMGPCHASIVSFAAKYAATNRRFEHRTIWLCSDLPDARAALVEEAIKTNCEHTLFVDDDMTFKYIDFAHLLDAQVDVVSGLYRKKDPNPMYVGMPVNPENKNGELIEMEHIGLGFALFKTSVLKDIVKKYGNQPFLPLPGMAEDASLCFRYREMGGKIWLHPQVKLGHVGLTIFS